MLSLRQGHQDGPDKATEFTGDSSDGDVPVFTLVKAPELFVETMLSFESDGDDVWGLPLSSASQDQVCTRAMAVVPGGLDQKPADVDVAGFGDGAPIFFVARGVFRGDEAEVSHKLAGRSEASDVVDLAEDSQSGEGFEPSQTAECLDLLSEMRELCNAIEFKIESPVLGLEILQVFEFDSESSLERAFET